MTKSIFQLSFLCLILPLQSFSQAPQPEILFRLSLIKNSLSENRFTQCAEITKISSDVQKLQESKALRRKAELNSSEIMESLFQIRQQIRNNVTLQQNNCINEYKELITATRQLSDLAGVYFTKVKQITSNDVVFQNQKIPLLETIPGYYGLGNKHFQFQSGDLMITKGISFISSTISQLPYPSSVFSHVVFVHHDAEKNKASTLESYVGTGVKLYNMNYALKNENFRILVLRSKDQQLAKDADRYIFNRLTKQSYSYDYELDFNDNSRYSCEEIAYDAYKTASNSQILLPYHSSVIQRKNQNFIESLGLRNGDLMSPSDMEIDPRFEVIHDWTDLRLVRDSWRKDVVMSEMFRWMDQHDYKFHRDLGYLGQEILISLRGIPLLGGLLDKILSIQNDIPNDSIMTITSIKQVGTILYDQLRKADQAQFLKTGLWMTHNQLKKTLEDFRIQDLQNYQAKNYQVKFHFFFRK